MYISYNWLKDFVKFPKSYSPEKLAQDLNIHTVEVESVLDLSKKYNNIVVGKVLEEKKHPQADKLKIAKVDVGKEVLDIVCGAPNLEKGQLVPVAKIGAIMPNGMEIQEVNLRGEISRGMICAEDELGLGTDHDGIMVLNKSAKIGMDFSKYLNLDDFIIEIDNKSLSNRPDLWGHYGIAREVSVFCNEKLINYEDKVSKKKIKENDGKLNIKVEDKNLCPYYSAIKISGIEIKESPLWLKNRLLSVGISSINNIVDVTNYVMLELGQPLHAFDAEGIEKIVVKQSKKEEEFLALDEKTYNVSKESLLITNGKDTLALAGVMGGKESAVKKTTKEIIIESANFNGVSVRKTSQFIHLRTDASSRYEKFLDPALCELAMKRVIGLILEIIPGAKISSELKIVDNIIKEDKNIDINFDWIRRRIGQNISNDYIKNVLIKLGFVIKKEDDENILIKTPSWRATKDVSIPEDIVEEIVRMYGYNNIELKLPSNEIKVPEINNEYFWEQKIKDILAFDANLTEVHSHIFVNSKQLSKLNIDSSNHLDVINPLNKNLALLRQSLFPNILEIIKNNQARYDNIGIFEIGSVYFNAPGKTYQDNKKQEFLPYQESRIIIVISNNKKDVEIFSEIKSKIEIFLKRLFKDVSSLEYFNSSIEDVLIKTKLKANIKIKGEVIGVLGKLDNELANKTSCKKKVVFADISLNKIIELLKIESKREEYKELDKFPAVVRDLAFVIDKNISYNQLKNAIINFNEYIESVKLFDVYEGDKLDEGKKSLAFHIEYRSEEKTLTAIEVDEIQKRLIKDLNNNFEVRIRDF
ncbi:phenylalanine--tRNA ligase subunit beta [bacterium]|nr:phenylalanine--tRNA ligase subunit beta [bacterium]